MLLQVGNARGRVSMIVILVVLKISSSTIVSAWISPHRRRIARRLPLSEKDGIHYSKRYIVQRRDIVQAPSSSSVSASSMQHDSTQVYRTLYPPSLPHSNGTLQVDDIHTLYYEIHGQGSLNALFLHGGPGAGCFPNHARFFDPDRYTTILLDQRGSGKSTPRGCVERNTLPFIVLDCERLRRHLGIDSWDLILGGSWGTTVALAYAQTFPWSMKAMVLRGICTFRRSEVDWLFNANGGAAQQFPQAWKNFSHAVGSPEESNKNQSDGRRTLHRYYDKLLGNNNATRLAAARSWMGYEFGVTSILHNQTSDWNTTVLVSPAHQDYSTWRFENQNGKEIKLVDQSPAVVASKLRLGVKKEQLSRMRSTAGTLLRRPVQDNREVAEKISTPPSATIGDRRGIPTDFIPAQNMLTCFYSVNENYVLGDMINLLDEDRTRKISNLICIGVHGGMDRICPPDTALDLLEVLPEMELRIPLASGHSMYDPGITHELVMATDRLADRLSTSK